MKYSLLSLLILALTLLSMPVFSQEEKKAKEEVAGTGLPGDNLDLYAVLDLFQKSKTIEEFEKSLNAEETKINNLDLNLDEKVDFIKVETTKKDDDFTFVLQVPVSEKETQDVAVILLTKDKEGELTLQIVGDKDLYGKDYIVEPQATTPGVTPNPGYTGDDPVTEILPATTTVVQVQSAPIVQYVYSPAYVPYYPPYYYGYYPPYYNPWIVPISIGIYAGYHNHYHHHHGYGHGNTTIIHNENNFNNYNDRRNNSNTVADNKAKGNYRNNGNPSASTRPSTGASTRPSTGAGASTRPSTGASTRPSTGASASTRPSTGSSASTRPSNGPTATNRSSGASASSRPSTSPSTRPSSSSYGGSSRTSSSSMGASRSMNSGGGGYSGGARGGGGGGGRRR
jgi:hypothetical protein